MNMFSPTMDEEWSQWYRSPQQRFLRKLEEALATEVVTTVMSYPFTMAVKVGIVHKMPYLLAGVAINKNRRNPFVILGFIHSCNGISVSILNKVFNPAKYECAGCADEARRYQEAKERVLFAMSGHTPDDDEDSSQKGGLMQWP